jgi:hypothetical protein
MKRLLVVAAAAAVAAAPAGAAGSKTVRMAILHVVSGCHVWSTSQQPTATLVVAPGTRVEIRANCPMDFDFAQVRGPRLALGAARTYAGTSRVLVFKQRGTYVLTATNVQTPEQRGLETLGATNTPITLTVRVR